MPSVIATSAVRAGAPVPSTTDPPLITRSCIGAQLLEEGSNVIDQQVRFLERGEVPAAIEAGGANEIHPRLGVRAGNPEDLLGKHRGRGRRLDVLADRAEAG